MKISGVKVFQVTANDSDRQEIYVRIETDTNLTGLYGPINAEQAFIIHNRFAALLSGRDPLATEDLWEDMRRVDRHARAGHMMMAISAIDNALWDIRGKHYSQPVFKLLGGSRREIITTYASMLGYSVEPAEAAQKARQMYDQGFTAQKWFFKYAPSDGKKGMLKNLAMVEALRTELGPEATLMFDALWQWDVPYAMEMARDMMPYKPTWLEEPLHPEQLEGYKRIKDQTGIPLAAGEHFYTRWNVKPFLDAQCLDYIQTDPDWCGGITELVKICALADVYDVKVIPHGHHILAAIHVVASQPERLCPMAECLMKRHIEAMQYFHKTPIKAQNGQIKLPEAPGLGFELDNQKDQRNNRFEIYIKESKLNNHSMTMQSPACRWQDALPIGNGQLGALLFGGIQRETIVFNHENLWLPDTPKEDVPQMAQYLPKVRELIAKGDYAGAEDYYLKKWQSIKGNDKFWWPNPFQPAFEMKIENSSTTPFKNYRRSIDFKTAQATIKWHENNVAYERQAFASRADNVIVIRLMADTGKLPAMSIGLQARPFEANSTMVGVTIQDKVTFQTSADSEGFLKFTGKYQNSWRDGQTYGGLAKIVTDTGSVSADDNSLTIENASEVLIFVDISPAKDSDDFFAEMKTKLNAIETDYEKLWAQSQTLYSDLYDRVELNLASDTQTAQNNKTNEAILLETLDGNVSNDLINNLFHYSRYLFISSTGKMPANLQGLWNGAWSPPWGCDYTQDENLQMNYWQVLPGNLAELTEPYFDMIESQFDDWSHNARNLLGCRGLHASIKYTTHGRLHHIGNNWPWAFYTAGAGWLAQLFFDYWLFTGDKDFLANRTVPMLKQIALFYEDFLIESPDGKLMFSPSLSPENHPTNSPSKTTVNATMDIAVAREVLGNLITAANELNIDTDQIPKWQSIIDDLPAYETNSDGALKEWLHPDLEDNYHHRHQSHIYPVFPGFEATEENTPELFEACKKAVEQRLVVGLQSQTGWSLAHMANIYARINWGQRALECIEILCRACLGPNLLTYHNDWRMLGLSSSELGSRGTVAPFQIDANFGLTAAVIEMLAFSTPGMVKLLPALPESWPKGTIKGIKCRGQIELSLDWDTETGNIKATMQSAIDQTIDIGLPKNIIDAQCNDGQTSKSKHGSQYVQLTLKAGQTAKLKLKIEN